MEWITLALSKACRFAETHPHIPLTKIAAMFGVTTNALSNHLYDYKDYKYRKDGRAYSLTDEELESVATMLHNPNITLEEICEIYGNADSTLRKRYEIVTGQKWVSNTNIKKTIGFDENAFSELKTEEDAYWAGYLTEIGIFDLTYHSISFSAKPEDIDHVRAFIYYMKDEKGERRIEDRNPRVKNGNTRIKIPAVRYRCESVYDNIEKLGIIEKKPIKFGKETMLKSYVRGILDGAGTHFEVDFFECSTSKEIAVYLFDYFAAKAKARDKNIDPNTFMTIIQFTEDFYSLEVRGQNANIIAKYLYSGTNLFLPSSMEEVKKIQ